MKLCECGADLSLEKPYWKRNICSTCHWKKYYADECKCGKLKNKKSKVCKDCQLAGEYTGELSPTWTGGRTKHKKGYVEVSAIDPATGERKYALEHRYVMQQHLGRPLERFETVHHKNGIKDDNRIENLELWSSLPQPSGQRVSDLIEYANHIRALYGEDPAAYNIVDQPGTAPGSDR